jgi:site-specific DNA-methyltransferase (adenine-specific)
MKLLHGDCLVEMDKLIAEGVKVDLTVTSPPYDNLRTYNDSLNWNESIWKSVIDKLYDITKDGGVVVWIVNDATIKGSETGTSFKQALYFKEVGFNLHDTMIWNKPNAMPQVDKSRYCQSFEYMFILSKGKPKTAIPKMIPTKNGGKYMSRGDGNSDNINKKGGGIVNKDRISFNVYNLNVDWEESVIKIDNCKEEKNG